MDNTMKTYTITIHCGADFGSTEVVYHTEAEVTALIISLSNAGLQYDLSIS